MAKEIPILGKIWLCFVAVLAVIGVVTNAMAIPEGGTVFVISMLACAGELVAVIFLLLGKGMTYFFVYAGCYLVNAVLTLMFTTDTSVAYYVGFVVGIAINIGLTYLSAKDTFKKA